MARFDLESVRKSLSVAFNARVRRGGFAFADQLVVSATNFLTGIAVGRACSQEGFGLYLLGFSLVLVGMRLQGSIVSSSYMVFAPRKHGREKEEYTGSAVLQQIAISVLGIASLLVYGVISKSFGIFPEFLPIIKILSVLIFFLLFRDFVRNLLFAGLEFSSAFYIDISVAIVQLGLIAFFVSKGTLTPARVFVAAGVGSTIGVIGWIVGARKNIVFRVSRFGIDFLKNWGFGKWIFASSLLGEISVYVYPWVLTFFHDTGETGVWAACFGTVAIANPIIIGMVNYVGPEISHAYTNDGVVGLRKIVKKSNVTFMILLAPFVLAICLIGGWLVTFFYGVKYQGNGLVVGLLALDMLISPLRFSFSRALFALEHPYVDFVTNFVPVMFLVFVGIGLVAKFGTVGVAWSIFGGGFLATIAKWVAYARETRSVE